MCSFEEIGKLDLLPVCIGVVSLAFLEDKTLRHCFMYYVLIHEWKLF